MYRFLISTPSREAIGGEFGVVTARLIITARVFVSPLSASCFLLVVLSYQVVLWPLLIVARAFSFLLFQRVLS